MNDFNRIIRLKIWELCMTFIFVVFSFFLWDDFRKGEVIQQMKSVHDEPSFAYVNIVKESKYLLTPMSDEEAQENILPKLISMQNGTHLNTSYIFGLKIDKSSTLDFRVVKISFLDHVFYLKDFYETEDQNYYYFLLDRGSLDDTVKSKIYDVRLWVDEQSPIPNQMSLLYEFTNLADLL